MESVEGTVGVVGAGYVGLTSAACLARLGRDVVCVDVDAAKVGRLRRGEVDIAEPGLAELVRAGLDGGRLRFTTGAGELGRAGIVLLCLPTPPGPSGQADLGVVEAVLRALRTVLAPGCVLITKSTVPVGTTERARELLGRDDVAVVSNPEFLREGHAVHDFLHPDRIVLGSDDPAAAARAARLYRDLRAPVVTVGPASAELAKYASNAFLALKVSYVNELAALCEVLDADIGEVTRVMGMDERIGAAFLSPGPGWGGSCLPKDTSALVNTAAAVGLDLELVAAAVRANAAQPERVVGKVRAAAGGSLAGVRVGLLGLAFKAGTGDLRHSPGLEVARRLAAEGAVLTGYDPCVPAPGPAQTRPVRVVDDPYLVGLGAEVVVVLTDAAPFPELDWARLARPGTTVVDTRNALDAASLAARGVHHVGTGLGRGTVAGDGGGPSESGDRHTAA